MYIFVYMYEYVCIYVYVRIKTRHMVMWPGTNTLPPLAGDSMTKYTHTCKYICIHINRETKSPHRVLGRSLERWGYQCNFPAPS